MAVNYCCPESTVTSRLGKDESVSITDRRSRYTEFIYRYCAKSGCSVRRDREPSRIDPYSSAAMLNLRRIKALFLHGKPSTEFARLAKATQACRAKTKLFIPLRLNMAAE